MKIAFSHIVIFALLAIVPMPAEAGDLRQDIQDLRGRVERMAQGYGYVKDAEWKGIQSLIDELRDRARILGNEAAGVEIALVSAVAWTGLRNDVESALGVLRNFRAAKPKVEPELMSRLYVMEADLLARKGRADDIQSLIRDYKAGPYLLKDTYGFTGGQGRDEPLGIVRPGAGATGSLPLTAMELSLKQARNAGGQRLPEFRFRDLDGRELTPKAMAGRIVLYDFWVPGWRKWEENVAQMVLLKLRYPSTRFEIVGLCLNQDGDELKAEIRKRQGLTWPQVGRAAGADWVRQLGIFGESTNMLVDGHGRIIGRNLYGADLVQAVKRALGEP